MTEKAKDLQAFLAAHIDNMWTDGGSREDSDFPEYDLYARDYLEYAEQSLRKHQLEPARIEILNYLSHLKRAMDCQIDTFFSVFNLEKVFAKRNLKVETKLAFLAACGIFSSRTLVRLNTFRNRMEHKYEVPKVEDIEAHFDLVTAFVAILETAIAGLLRKEYGIGEKKDKNGNPEDKFSIEYCLKKPEIIAKWSIGKSATTLRSTPDDHFEFAYFMKVLFLLRQVEGMASDAWLQRKLSEKVAN